MSKEDVLIEKYIKLAIKSEEYFLDTIDIKAKKYNSIAKNLYELRREIKEQWNYRYIYINIIDKIKDEKYWQMRNDLAESLYFKDKLLALEIYKTWQWHTRDESRIQELEQELIEEWKLPKKSFFWKLFK